jgi:hypothetical protein
MAKEFKIKYATRAKLQKAIQQEIKAKGLIQDWAMHDSIRISSATGDLNTLYVTINCMYYYVFQDRGANLTNGGVIDPQFITYDAFNSSMGMQFKSEAFDQYVSWMMANYPILDVGNIIVEKMKVKYRYNVIGGQEWGYTGFYPSSGWFSDSDT